MTEGSPTTTGTSTVPPGAALAAHVRGYAEAVRLHLSDLGPEVTDDLTGGLEADLTEALADRLPARASSGEPDDVLLDLALAFGSAVSYAAELRAAAGLPPAGPPRRPGLGDKVAERVRRGRERWAARLEPVTSQAGWESLKDLALTLRPVWWLARGWVLGVVLTVVLSYSNAGVLTTDNGWYLVPASSGQLLIMAGCALVSVQWGRGRWLLRRWQGRTTAVASVLAVLALPSVLGATGDLVLPRSMPASSSYDLGYQDGIAMAGYSDDAGEPGVDGVWVDGMQVSNLFVFDAQGDPVRDVQVFDDRGRPVRTVSESGSQTTWAVPQIDGTFYFRPALADDGHERWNVYPLQALPESAMRWDDDGDELEPVVGVRPEDMPWPFLKAPTSITREGAVGDPPGANGEAPAPSPSGDPTPGPSGEPSQAPTGTQRPVQGTAVVDASLLP
jgi:hypothetical protein